MKDIDKFKNLMKEFGINYKIEVVNGQPAQTLIYLTEDFNHLMNYEDDNNNQNIVYNSSENKVTSYTGFYTYFAFDKESGKFDIVGIFE